jgi:hypothetical protein
MSRLSRIGVALVLLVGASRVVSAQTELMADKIRLGTAECVQQTGSGTPEGAVTGKVCDTYLRTNGTTFETILYVKTTASGTTGWQVAGGGWTRMSTNVTLINSGDAVIPAATYTSNLGSVPNSWLTLFAAELHVGTLVAENVLATIGGRVVVAPTTQLNSDLRSDETIISVKHNEIALNDILYLEAGGNIEYMQAVSTAQASGDHWHYAVTRNLDGSGANEWAAGDAVLNMGTTGDGYLDIFSNHAIASATQYGPAIVGRVKTGTAWNASTARFAVGNLDGKFGYSGSVFGFAAGSPTTGSWVKIDDTNGLRMGNNTTTHVQITTAGAATFTGDGNGVTNINGGNIATNSITASQIAAGTITATEITGTTLSVIASDMGSLTAGNITISSGGNYIWLNDAGDGALNIGGSTKASAPFRVTAAGALTATSATITGTVNATAGYFGNASTDVSIDSDGIVVGSSGRISAGGGQVTIDAGGINLGNGNYSDRRIDWSGGSYIYEASDNVLGVRGNSGVSLISGSAVIDWKGTGLIPGGAYHLGSSGNPWENLYLAGDFYFDTPPNTTAALRPIVWDPSVKALYEKSDGQNTEMICATGFDSLTAEFGIITNYSCVAPGMSVSALRDRVQALEARVASLEAALLALLEGRK